MSIANVVIDYKDRVEGSESKLNTYSDGFKVLKTIGKLYRNYKPLSFFSIIALLMTAISACFFIPIFVDYIKTGLVPKFPTLIVCGFVMIAAILSLFSGLILETLREKDRRDFEMLLVNTERGSGKS